MASVALQRNEILPKKRRFALRRRTSVLNIPVSTAYSEENSGDPNDANPGLTNGSNADAEGNSTNDTNKKLGDLTSNDKASRSFPVVNLSNILLLLHLSATPQPFISRCALGALANLVVDSNHAFALVDLPSRLLKILEEASQMASVKSPRAKIDSMHRSSTLRIESLLPMPVKIFIGSPAFSLTKEPIRFFLAFCNGDKQIGVRNAVLDAMNASRDRADTNDSNYKECLDHKQTELHLPRNTVTRENALAVLCRALIHPVVVKFWRENWESSVSILKTGTKMQESLPSSHSTTPNQQLPNASILADSTRLIAISEEAMTADMKLHTRVVHACQELSSIIPIGSHEVVDHVVLLLKDDDLSSPCIEEVNCF